MEQALQREQPGQAAAAVEVREITIDEKDLFNGFLASCAKGHILQTWEWGELKAKTGWTPIRLVAERRGEIVGAISVLKRPVPTGKWCIFYAPRGPVLDIEDRDVWDALLDGVKARAKKHNAIFLKIDPDVKDDNTLWRERIEGSGFKPVDKGPGFEGVQPRFVFRLDISPDEETLLANCHQKTRYNIRLAEKRGVEIIENAPREQLEVFYKILSETASRDKFLIRPFSYYEAFYDLLVPQGLAEMFLATYEGEVIAGTLAFKLGDKAWYIYGASSNAHRNVMPNYLIQWKMICWAKKHGCTMYDFRGVPGDVDENHPLYGLVKFKRGFNGEYTKFIGEYDLIYKPAVYRLYHFAEPLYQKTVRKLINFKKRLRGQTK